MTLNDFQNNAFAAAAMQINVIPEGAKNSK